MILLLKKQSANSITGRKAFRFGGESLCGAAVPEGEIKRSGRVWLLCYLCWQARAEKSSNEVQADEEGMLQFIR